MECAQIRSAYSARDPERREQAVLRVRKEALDSPVNKMGRVEGGRYLRFIHSFIHSGHFYCAPSSPLPLRGAPDYSTDTVSEFHAEAHRQLQVKDLPKVPT